TIHTWLERFNKQKPRSFEKATASVDAENSISHMEKIFHVMGCEDAFKTRLAVYKFEVANAARNYEIFHERDDDDAERPGKQKKSGDWHQPTTQQSSHRNHGHNNDRYRSDRRGGSDNHRSSNNSSNNNYSGNNNRLNFKSIRSSSTHKHDPNITTPMGVSSTAGTCFKCGQTGHLQKDCKKNTAASTSGQADKKPDHFHFASTYLTVS
nr:zinc finger, CCHC-type, retrotransposon Gag domain protein [Tanacetum cinerariifolium]